VSDLYVGVAAAYAEAAVACGSLRTAGGVGVERDNRCADGNEREASYRRPSAVQL
jgi:hypothetical protein